MMGLNSPSSTNSSNSLDDDELTNLTWLQNNNLLQNMTQDDETTLDCGISKVIKEDNENVSPKKVRQDLKSTLLSTGISSTAICSVPPVRYNPLLHTHTKPPYSFSSLICMAIESSPTKALPVKDIYSWITKNFPFYQDAPDGWKNTVRHNLSLNKCFQKIEKGKKFKDANCEEKKLLNEQLASKGSLWCIDQNLRPNLLQSIKKTPAHIYPYMSTAKTSTNLVRIKNVINRTNSNQNANKIDLNNVHSTVTVGNNISSTNNQSPKKIIAIEKLPNKNILTTTKRVLIPITKVASKREPKEADAAESMLTLTQCSTANNSNNGNTYYIITNKNDNILPIQLNKPLVSSVNCAKQQSANKNQITILTQPIIRAATSTNRPTISIKPIVTIAKEKKEITTTSMTAPKFSTSIDHNYSSQRTANNVITLPITSLPIASLAGQKVILTTTSNNKRSTNTTNFVPVINKGVNRIITITPAKASPTKNIIIKSPFKQPVAEINKKAIKKVDEVNDEDGLKCAEALFNLANGSTVKLSKSVSSEKKIVENKDQTISKTQTLETVTSSAITRSAAKKLKTTI